MGRINPDDWDKYASRSYKTTEKFAVYGVEFDCPLSPAEAEKQFRNLYARTKRAIEKSSSDVRMIMGLSNVDGKTCYKTKQRTKGRPRNVVHGKATKQHIHLYTASPDKGLYTFTQKIVDGENKRQLKKGLKPGRFWKNSNKENRKACCMPVQYVENQSTICFRYGDLSPFE